MPADLTSRQRNPAEAGAAEQQRSGQEILAAPAHGGVLRRRGRGLGMHKALAGLAAIPAGLDIFDQQRRRTIFGIAGGGEEDVEDFERGVEADEIGQRQRPHRVVGAQLQAAHAVLELGPVFGVDEAHCPDGVVAVVGVAGRADVLIVPNMEAGNMLAKELSFVARAESAGLVLGAKVPVMLTSRADNERARLASAAVAQLYHHYRTTGTAVSAEVKG